MKRSSMISFLLILFVFCHICFSCDGDRDSSSSDGPGAESEDDEDDDVEDDKPDDDDSDDDSSDGDDDDDDDDDNDNDSGPQWISEIVDANAYVWGHEFIDVGPDNTAHMVYNEVDTQMVFYAKQAKGTWAVESLQEPGRYPVLEVDNDGNAHIVYIYDDGTDKLLTYGTNLSGSWVMERILSYHLFEKPTLAIDEEGAVHIAVNILEEPMNPEFYLAYITNRPGGWITENLGPDWGYASLALDSEDNPHICGENITSLFYVTYFGPIIHATIQNGSWQYGYVAQDTFNDWSYPFIALDSNDKIYVSYSRDKNYGPKLGLASADGPGWPNWSSQHLHENDWEYVGPVFSHGVAQDGTVHVVYTTSSDDRVWYGTDFGGTWSYQSIDNLIVASEMVSIAVDSTGTPHVGYDDKLNQTIRYAHPE